LLSLPDKGMLIMDPGRGVRHRVVLNGRVAWQAIDYGDGTQKIVRMDEIDTASLMWSLRVHNTMRRLALEGSVADMTARKIVHEGEPAYALSKPMPDGSVFEAVLDAATLYLLRSEENVPGKEGMERLEVIYGEHRMVSGIVEPYRSTTYKNGLMFNEVLLESVDRDPGLMSSLFEVPEELLK